MKLPPFLSHRLAILILGLSIVTIGTQQYSLAETVKLSETQREQSRALNLRIILPSYIPQGFQVMDVKILPEGMKGYAILFGNANNTCFLIEATNGGIGGGLELESTLPINSKLFGSSYVLNYGTPKDPVFKQQFPQPDLYSDWMELERHFYRSSGALMALEQYDYTNCRQDISPSEAIKVIESLADSPVIQK